MRWRGGWIQASQQILDSGFVETFLCSWLIGPETFQNTRLDLGRKVWLVSDQLTPFSDAPETEGIRNSCEGLSSVGLDVIEDVPLQPQLLQTPEGVGVETSLPFPEKVIHSAALRVHDLPTVRRDPLRPVPWFVWIQLAQATTENLCEEEESIRGAADDSLEMLSVELLLPERCFRRHSLSRSSS